MSPAPRLWLVAGLLALAVPATTASPVGAESHILASVPTTNSGSAGVGTGGGYVVDVAVVDVAGTLTFTNTDLRSHDVVASDDGPATNPWCSRYTTRACPLFASPLVGGNPLAGPAEAVVEGIHQLTPLVSYEFECSIHPGMEGTLTAI
ncbi:MAG TPA: hypothetical protein VI997_03160 [Candidatus Thermoplasmatota archaeon]|nr:hypothetical protein [Candidatus Thermoplasmatota archaeon]